MANKGGRMSKSAVEFPKATARALNQSNRIINYRSFKTAPANKRAKSSLRCIFNNGANAVTTNIINPNSLQADVVQTPSNGEASTTTTIKPSVEETGTKATFEATDEYDSQDSDTLTEESQRAEAMLRAKASTSTAAPATSTEAPATSTEAPATSTEAAATSTEAPATSTEAPATTTESQKTSTPTVASEVPIITVEPITRLTAESSEKSTEARRKSSVGETTTMPKTEEMSTPPTGEMAKGKDEMIEPMTTEEPQKDPYAIDIPLEKKISKHVQRKLWEEIERRKPFIPKHVALHIQKYAKPPFETRGCKFRGSCSACG